MSDKLISYVNNQLNERGWSQRELSRRAGLTSSTVSNVLGQIHKPGRRFCAGVAQAFNMPVEEMYQLAGFLPTMTDKITRLVRICKGMSDADIDKVIEYAEMVRKA